MTLPNICLLLPAEDVKIGGIRAQLLFVPKWVAKEQVDLDSYGADRWRAYLVYDMIRGK